MKSKLMTIMIALSTVALVSATAFAGGEGKYNKSGKDASGTVFHGSQRLSEVIGSQVTNDRGERLGHVNDLIADQDGRITYLVIARAGGMGTDSDLVAVPASAASPRTASNGTVMIDMDMGTLAAAPSFSAANYPDMSDRRWEDRARGYFGTGPAQQRQPEPSANQDIWEWLRENNLAF